MGDIQPRCHMDHQDSRSRTSGNGMRGMRLEAWGSLSHREDGDVSQEETADRRARRARTPGTWSNEASEEWGMSV